jgi:hypothetical protein
MMMDRAQEQARYCELPDAVWIEEKSSGSFDSAPVSLNPLNILEALRSG